MNIYDAQGNLAYRVPNQSSCAAQPVMRPALAFLQNIWVHHPERLQASFAARGELFRLAMMRKLLFYKSKTGRNLTKAFGDEMLTHITFEETTRQIAGDPKTIFPADVEHIQKCLETHRPRIVLAFGQIAHEAVSKVINDWKGEPLGEPLVYIAAHHPASRHPTSWASLLRAAEELGLSLKNKGAK